MTVVYDDLLSYTCHIDARVPWTGGVACGASICFKGICMNRQMDEQSVGVLEQAKAFNAIRRQLRQELGGRWPVGYRLPPIKELAQQLGAGQTNTHRAVKELVKEGLLVSRPGHGTFVTPHAALMVRSEPGGGPLQRQASGPLTGRAIVALVSSIELDPSFERAVAAFSQVVQAGGADVMRMTYSQASERKILESDAVAAALMVNPSFPDPVRVPESKAIVFLSTSQDLDIRSTEGYDVVSVDSEQGGRLAGEHFAADQSRGVMFIGRHWPDKRDQYDRTSAARLHGFEQGLQQAVPKGGQVDLPFYAGTEGARYAGRYVQLKHRPHCIFAASDEIAIGFIYGALAHGLVMGKDYRIIGFDGQQRGRELPAGKLTSVEVPFQLMGTHAGQLLMDRLTQPGRPPHTVSLGCRLFVGQSA